jgi:hypothetical protein
MSAFTSTTFHTYILFVQEEAKLAPLLRFGATVAAVFHLEAFSESVKGTTSTSRDNLYLCALPDLATENTGRRLQAGREEGGGRGST